MNPTPTPIPCAPPPPPGGCYECPVGSGQVICVDGPYTMPEVIPALSWEGLALMALLFAAAGARRLRG